LTVEGKCFTPVKVSKNRNDYTSTGVRTALLSEAIDVLVARDGADTLKNFDGIFFLYAGDTAAQQRTSLYWPHRATFTHKGERWSYFICPEGGGTMKDISTICHEFGHMLGLPDLYAKPEVPDSEGTPVVIDPTEKQKLILSPIEGTTNECFKIPIRDDGSEYFLLENRRKTGFDTDLRGEGLLIWRVVEGRPILEESHGVTTSEGPRVFPTSVPYPSKANHSFTPYTTPSSKGVKPGSKQLFITNIRRLADGRIAFQVGYEYY
jgi:hypothetical protein